MTKEEPGGISCPFRMIYYSRTVLCSGEVTTNSIISHEGNYQFKIARIHTESNLAIMSTGLVEARPRAHFDLWSCDYCIVGSLVPRPLESRYVQT